jgi:hypothetical protein
MAEEHKHFGQRIGPFTAGTPHLYPICVVFVCCHHGAVLLCSWAWAAINALITSLVYTVDNSSRLCTECRGFPAIYRC